MLRKNATIAIIAPASAPDMTKVEHGMARLRDWGFRVLEGHNLRAHFRYTAGTAQQRTEDLLWALSDPQIDAVWLAQGGYGCVHCIPDLPDNLPKDRIVIGFSDATSLFCALMNRGYSNLLHGPMVVSLATDADEETHQSVYAMLAGTDRSAMLGTHLCGPKETVIGPLIGGNLSILASIAGTPWAIRAEGAILLLEEILGDVYRIDRTLVQLRASGFLNGVKGIALGEFIRCMLPKNADFTLNDVFIDLLEPLGIPVVKDIGVGHGARNLTWRYGEQVTLRDGSIHPRLAHSLSV